MTDQGKSGKTREYLAIVWKGDDHAAYLVGERLSLIATSLEDARAQVEVKYGSDIKSSIWNEEDANRLR